MSTKTNRIGTAQAARAGCTVLAAGGANQTVRFVYMCMVQYMTLRKFEMAPTHWQLAELVGRSERTIRRSLAFLVSNGFLRVVRHGNRYTATVYTLGSAVLLSLDRARMPTADK